MAKYRITKNRCGGYTAERKQGFFDYWEYLGTREDYDLAMRIVEQEKQKDSEGLPKVVWRDG